MKTHPFRSVLGQTGRTVQLTPEVYTSGLCIGERLIVPWVLARSDSPLFAEPQDPERSC